jgi:hypothetical protein
MPGQRRDMPADQPRLDAPGSDASMNWKESVDPDIDEGHSVY